MNPVAQAALSSVIRWALTFAAGWFVSHGIWTMGEATSYVGAAALGLLALGWSLWNKYKSRVAFLMALSMAPGTTENEVHAAIKQGEPTPTVLTPPDTVPGVPADPTRRGTMVGG